MNCNCYTADGETFEAAIEALLSMLNGKEKVIRLAFFGNPPDNEKYREQREMIGRRMRECFGELCPPWSYVAQEVLTADLAMEVYTAGADFAGEICYKQFEGYPYVTLQTEKCNYLVAGGFGGSMVEDEIRRQAEEAFGRIGRLLAKEGFSAGEIVRQWNYIERITEFDDKRQRYQEFNDARSRFYAGGFFRNGYPAATGIGTRQGGLLIDFIAARFTGKGGHCVPLNNELQVAAHAYSQEVLLGREENCNQKTTPKFERAKVVMEGKKGMIYVSGTAAIRGEQSLMQAGISEQVRTTWENIDSLVGKPNLRKAGIEGESELLQLRVYLKRREDREEAKQEIERHYGKTASLYLLADICREELLVEVEAVGSINT